MSDTLAEICARKRDHVAARKRERPFSVVEAEAKACPPPRGFAASLMAARDAGRYGLICEIKKASPSKGVIRADFQPAELARAYEAGGADCLSVLTDEPYFQGRDAYLTAARGAAALPVLRKDFMLEDYQIAEARALGADCILLIMAALSDGAARALAEVAQAYGMDVLVEVHDRNELNRALEIPAQMIGINNRNLKTLSVDLQTTVNLAPLVPETRMAVAESGLTNAADLKRCADAGVTTFLIGEALMRQENVMAATAALREPAA